MGDWGDSHMPLWDPGCEEDGPVYLLVKMIKYEGGNQQSRGSQDNPAPEVLSNPTQNRNAIEV